MYLSKVPFFLNYKGTNAPRVTSSAVKHWQLAKFNNKKVKEGNEKKFQKPKILYIDSNLLQSNQKKVFFMATKVVSVSTLKKGNYVVIDGAACTVSDIQISRPGKHGHAKVRLSAIGIIDDKKRVVVMPGHDNVEVPIIDKRTAQVLSIQVNTANVMDSESYETFDLEIPEEFKSQVVEGATVLYWDILGQKMIKQVKGS